MNDTPIPREIEKLHDLVARQHALFVRLLPISLQAASIDAYLLYRMLDTVEDAPLNKKEKEELLDTIAGDFLPGLVIAAARLHDRECVREEYRLLLGQADQALSFHTSLDGRVREFVEETGQFMAREMLRFTRQFHAAENAHFLADLAALDAYCLAVAGCVGELNTRLFQLAGMPLTEQHIAKGIELGKYLQLVNVLRDAAKDTSGKDKSYIPRDIATLSPVEQVNAIIAFARAKEPAIEAYCASLPRGGIRSYCVTLYRIAKLHFDHFARHPELLERRVRVPAWRIFAVLPLSLKTGFLMHKAGRCL